jgi:hypothetical protein
MPIAVIPRTLGPLSLDVVVRELHESTLTITQNPVEFGADITDHAYVEPKRLRFDAVMAGNAADPTLVAASYQALVRLQESREPFDVQTGLDIYRNMLIERIEVDRDKDNSRILLFRADLTEVILVDTESTQSGADGSANSGRGARQSGLSKGRLASGITRDRGSPVVQRGNAAVQPAGLSLSDALARRDL